ncbi:thioredoxin [Desulfobotulus mexicanus]|uniref:Thioredoxin n=1 Tax=Desulfobotulus mexicanus TaxID=2586642 RepID=A0A5S5MDQ0_9BACT|nr:thioredoxin [Desulfobotulus mexicanus]TYT73745.1 thioredoxin [Desulfobotulus mexicanus]
MAEGVLEIGDADFEKEVLQSDKPVLIDFWAPWCGPCRAMTPIIEEMAKKFEGKAKIAKCNVDDNPITPGKFDVKAIPTLIFFKDGKMVEQVTGMMAKPKIEELLNQMIG